MTHCDKKKWPTKNIGKKSTWENPFQNFSSLELGSQLWLGGFGLG